MTTIKLNNENKTEITFSYDNGLPYKKAIRPSIEYGDWKINSHITLIKVNLSDDEVLLFKNIDNIKFQQITKIKKEVWFDLIDVYLVFQTNSYLDNHIQNENFILVFMNQEKILSSCGFSK